MPHGLKSENLKAREELQIVQANNLKLKKESLSRTRNSFLFHILRSFFH
jgi:hypothetical protein